MGRGGGGGGFRVLCAAAVLLLPTPGGGYPIPPGPAGALYDRFVLSIPDAKPCVLLVDHVGEMGCSSPREVAGPLRVVATDADVAALAAADRPAMVLMDSTAFDERLDALAATGRVQGVLVHRTPAAASASPAETVPNHRFAPSQSPWVFAPWNPSGTGRLLARYRFPVWLTANDTAFAALARRAQENREMDARGDGGPRWVAQMALTMSSHHRTAAECLRDRRCQPLGGGTTWATLRPLEAGAPPRPLVACMTGISAAGLFHDAVPAASAVVAQVVAMLTAFDALVKMPNPEALDKEILFLFFPGEDFGYLGSSRFLWDLAQPYTCAQDGDAKNQLACRKPYLPTKEYRKLRPDRFAFLLDVSQVADMDSPGLFVHSAQANKNTSALAEALRRQGATVVSPGLKRGIPPSPLVSFLAHPDVPADAGAAVLAGYRDTFPGTAYASPDDTAGTVSLARVTEAAGVIASALWALAGGNGSVAPDPQLAGTLLGCLTADFRCDLVRGLFPGGGKPPKTTAWYVGAFQHRYEPGTPEQRFVYRFLAERSAVASAGNCTAPSDCDYRQKGLTCVRGTCMRTAAYMHQGFSPAVEWDYTDNRWVMNQTLADRYGTTVESDWPAAIGVRVLQEDDGRHAPGHAAAGLATTALAAAAWLLAAPYLSAKFKLD